MREILNSYLHSSLLFFTLGFREDNHQTVYPLTTTTCKKSACLVGILPRTVTSVDNRWVDLDLSTTGHKKENKKVTKESVQYPGLTSYSLGNLDNSISQPGGNTVRNAS